MERRKPGPFRGSDLPKDYLKMVKEIFTANFDSGLKALEKLSREKTRLEVTGSIFLDEIVIAVSLLQEKQLAATTLYASCDFDPKASSPDAQELLGACVDGLGMLLAQLLDPASPERIRQVSEQTLSALDDVPFEWSPVTIEKHRLYLMIDKSNPKLDELADEWLKKNDPEHLSREEAEQEETEKLFVTGAEPRNRKPGSVH